MRVRLVALLGLVAVSAAPSAALQAQDARDLPWTVGIGTFVPNAFVPAEWVAVDISRTLWMGRQTGVRARLVDAEAHNYLPGGCVRTADVCDMRRLRRFFAATVEAVVGSAAGHSVDGVFASAGVGFYGTAWDGGDITPALGQVAPTAVTGRGPADVLASVGIGARYLIGGAPLGIEGRAAYVSHFSPAAHVTLSLAITFSW